MDKINELLKGMQENPNNVNFSDICKVFDHYFGEARKKGVTSHRVYKTPWAGDPRVNIQDGRGKAKFYQVR
jgi:hypothetical protein